MLSVVRELSDEEALSREAVRLAALLDARARGPPRVALETLNARLARRLRRGGDSAFDERPGPC